MIFRDISDKIARLLDEAVDELNGEDVSGPLSE